MPSSLTLSSISFEVVLWFLAWKILHLCPVVLVYIRAALPRPLDCKDSNISPADSVLHLINSNKKHIEKNVAVLFRTLLTPVYQGEQFYCTIAILSQVMVTNLVFQETLSIYYGENISSQIPEHLA